MPMLLKGDDGKEFELAIIADRLPEAQDGFGDDETATISFRVATEDVEWEETAPGLGVHALHALAEWLEHVAEGPDSLTDRGEGDPGQSVAPMDTEIDLLEPELNFQVVKDLGEKVHLRVRFHLEDRPDEMVLDADTPEARHVDLKLPREMIRMAVTQLRADLEEFGAPMKDDLEGDEDLGLISTPDADLDIVDRELPYPPGAGEGEDNAGNR